MNREPRPTAFDATLLASLPEEARAGLSETQLGAVVEALERRRGAGGPAVDIGFTLPLPFSPYFVAIRAGRERRRAPRPRPARARRRLWTFGNIVFVVTVVILTHLIGLAALLFYSSILEF